MHGAAQALRIDAGDAGAGDGEITIEGDADGRAGAIAALALRNDAVGRGAFGLDVAGQLDGD